MPLLSQPLDPPPLVSSCVTNVRPTTIEQWLIDWLIIWCYTPYRQYFGRITAHWTVDCYLGCTCMLIIHVLEGRGESDDIAFASHSVGRDLIQLLTRVLLCPPILTWGCNVCGRIRRTNPFSRFTRQADGTMDLL